ncbi:cell division protein FtsQ [Parabacteroides gordonii]|uniref:cell division protein FtsQ/DivIB n=1 Tax=Parabacteroides gordonii TaxID=574930 RepID=UPI00241CBA24|nr:cell division protein FtsQ [Parabacteroides gordonii]
MIRIVSIIVATLLSCYIVFVTFFFRDMRQDKECHELQVVVKDSLDKHFVSESDLVSILKRADLNPIKKPMDDINTDRIENELKKNEMIARIEAYKTPSGIVKLEVEQKIPILRVISSRGNFYVDNLGSTMPVSRRYVADVPLVSGYVEKELAVTDLYKFALFLQENEFWNDQIEQIYVHPDNEVELIPRVGNHRIVLGTFNDFEEKLDNLRLFYDKVIPKTGWEKYSIINLKYKDQIVCTKR